MTRILFLGQKPLGEKCFDLLRRKLDVCGVVTNTTQDVWWGSRGIYDQCIGTSLPLIDNAEQHEKNIAQLIKDREIDTLISVQHSWILSDALLELVNYRAFNLHNAKIPDYRGYNACNHALLNGDQTFTSTIHWMVPKVDMGAIAFEEVLPIATNETAQSLFDKAQDAGFRVFELLVDCLVETRDIPKIPLVGEGHFYGRNDLEPSRQIQNPHDPEEVDRKSRAFHFPPFEPAYILVNGEKQHVSF